MLIKDLLFPTNLYIYDFFQHFCGRFSVTTFLTFAQEDDAAILNPAYKAPHLCGRRLRTMSD